MTDFKARMVKIGLAGICSAIILACSQAPPSGKIVVQPDTVYMGAAGWVISYSPNCPAHPTDNGKGGWYIDLPAQDGLHYVGVPYHANKPHKVLTITYRITGGPFTSVQTGCNEGADFRPMIERTGDVLSASQEFYRFWSGPPINMIGDGQIHTVSFPLTWDKWTSVFGHTNQTEFNTTMQSLMGVFVTFGGGCAAGHGDFGKGRFELLSFQIQ